MGATRVQRHARNAGNTRLTAFQIDEGTGQIQREVIARNIAYRQC
jgi:alkylation response protein AidB-like acyl-CoA dehydrogenase